MGISGLNEHNYGLNPQEVTQLFMERGKLVTYHKGTNVFTPGERADRIFLINHGEIKITRSSNDGKEIILDHLGPGSIFGENESISSTEWKNSAIAKKDSILHVLPKEALKEKMSKDPKVALWLMERLSNKQIQTENLLENLLFKSANAKVASVLVDLAKAYGVDVNDGTLIDYLITHQEIGNTIATTRETVSYAFMEFRQMGLIDTVKRRTVIKNLAGLEEIAEEQAA